MINALPSAGKFDVMLDLETMGSEPGCAIVSIGAVKFNADGIHGEEFYRRVDLDSCVQFGLRMDAGTVLWWLQQSEEARREVFGSDAAGIYDVMIDLNRWLDLESNGEYCVWGCGADFDNTVIAAAYKATQIKKPWKHGRNRCYRTVKKLAPEIEIQREGVHHHALDDARSQALHLIRILKSFPSY